MESLRRRGREWWWPRCTGCARWIKPALWADWYEDAFWRCDACRKGDKSPGMAEVSREHADSEPLSSGSETGAEAA